MPVHIRSGHGDLRLTLTNNGEVLDSQVAATPQEANRIAIMMIASRDAFDAGDTLSCRRAEEGRSATLVPGPGGPMTRIPDTRIHYASAGAVRRPRPADPARPTGIQLNYANLLDNLAEVGAPHLIGLQASGADIGERAEHLRKVLGAVTACLLGNHNVALHVGSPGPFTGMPIQRAGAQL